MVMLHGIEVPLKDLPQICNCGNWSCTRSYRENPETMKKLQKAREEKEE